MNSSNSTNHKVEILKKYADDEFVKKALHYTYTPYKQYNITSANLKKRADLCAPENKYDDLFQLLDDLSDRAITGHAALAVVNAFVKSLPDDHREIFYSIIDRNIETRATTTLINKVIPGLIPTFDVALAHDASKVKGIDLLDGEWLVSRKLDGIRCLCIIGENSDVKFFSRNGKEFETLEVLKQEVIRLDLRNCVLDGEVCISNLTGEDDFQGILKQIQRKDHTIPNPKYWVFDILTLDEFSSGVGKHSLTERLGRIESKKISHSKIISILPQIRISNEETLVSLKTESKDANWEGLIARRDVGYEGTRTKNMLKLKEFYDAEYIAVDTIMGPQRIVENGQERTEEVLSAVIINHMGNAVNVGSGFTLAERREYYKHPEKIIGKTITVQYFEETLDQDGNHSLRFPVFKWNHGESRSI